jgi:membrane-associated phospholipid phosphatase
LGDDTQPREAPTPRPSLRGFPSAAGLALAGLIALVASLDRLVRVDDRVWRAVLLMRGCGTDELIDRVVDGATAALTVLLVLVALLNVRMHGVRSILPWVSTCVLGLCASKTLKHLLTRERPSSLPDLAMGYSFPSAHVMNSVTAMVAIVALTRGFRRRPLWNGVAGVLTVIILVGRVLLGRHWISDAIGGVLAALVLVGFAVPPFTRRPVIAPVLLGLFLAGAFVLDNRLGDAGYRLPASLVGRGLALVDVDVGAALRSELVGAWKEAVEERSVGSLVWLEGSGTIPIEIPDVRRSLLLAFGGRTERVQPACMTLDVAVNGRTIAHFVPISGWREYRLPIEPGLARAGRNEVSLSAATRDGPARFAVTYVRIAERSPD